MSWTQTTDAPVSARAAALAPSLSPTELVVLETVLADRQAAVDCTAQELAQLAGVSRASVIRTAQALGYEGYPQMRVALARELAPDVGGAHGGSNGSVLHASLDRFARNLPRVIAALTDEAVDRFVALLDNADRVVVVATGLSTPAGLDLAMRLSAAGRPAEFILDTVAQQIAASNLAAGSVCLVVSGSGATETSIEAAVVARDAGADVLAVTSFARAPLLTHATEALVVPPVDDSFSGELLYTSRSAITLVLESLVEMLTARRGPRGVRARAQALSLIEKRISS